MKRFIVILVILGSLSRFYNFALGAGGFNGVVISTGTDTNHTISVYSNDDGGNRQAIVVGNRTSSDTVKTDGSGAIVAYVVNPTTTTITGTVPVSGTFWQATQPVSGTFWQATQPISGTVTATQAIDAALGASVSIKGSSNTVQITGTPTVDPSHAVDSSLNASVSIKGSSNTVSAAQSGTWTVQPGNTANSTAWLVDPSHAVDSSLNASVSIKGSSNTVKAAGDVANAATDSGNPVKIGGVGRTTYQTAVTDGQRVDGQFDSEGKQVVMPYAVPALSTSGVTAAMTGTTEVVLVSSGGSNINTYITGVSCFNSHATVGTVINLRNGRTIRYTGYAVAAGGGFVVPFQTPIAGASNTQWTAENATTGSNTYCNLVGYFAKN